MKLSIFSYKVKHRQEEHFIKDKTVSLSGQTILVYLFAMSAALDRCSATEAGELFLFTNKIKILQPFTIMNIIHAKHEHINIAIEQQSQHRNEAGVDIWVDF